MSHRVLIVEGEANPSESSVYAVLAEDGAFSCERIGWEELVLRDLACQEKHPVVVVAASHAPKAIGLFEWLRSNPVTALTLAVLPSDTDELLLRLAMETADDFIFPPIRAVELRHRVERMLRGKRNDAEAVSRRLLEEMGLTQLVGKEPVFLRAIEHVPRIARTDLPVLITGETGTGKELCARAIHHLGSRQSFPFIAVNCGAIPDQLFENELFGHARGAFTDAHREQKGLVAMAEGGTLFLDEIDALSMAAQAKLLRFMQDHTYRALGCERFARADLKVVAASNRDLEACVRDQQFRSDLYFRLGVLRVHLPPLRERRADIEMLAYHLLNECRASIDAAPKSFSRAALHTLTQYDWPGNVRELCNAVQRAVVACDGETILPTHIAVLPVGLAAAPLPDHFRAARAAAVAAFERRYVEDSLRRHRGNVTHAAREAQQDRRAFGRLIKKHRIDRKAI